MTFVHPRTARMNTHCCNEEKPTKSKGFEHFELQPGIVSKLGAHQSTHGACNEVWWSPYSTNHRVAKSCTTTAYR